MPCNSDYMNPTEKEKQLQETAQLLLFVLKRLRQAPDKKLTAAANDMYCRTDYVRQLCKVLTNLSEKDKKAIIYDAYNKTSRQLADWWERHQAADRKRKQVEAEAKREAKIRREALRKLTPAEIKALKLK